MERRLFIIRHGKSSWDHEGLADRDRPLNERGLKAADTMARRLLEKGLLPTLIFSSPAKRALSTALIMNRVWDMDVAGLQVHEDIYEAYTSEIAGVVARAPDEEPALAIFGHNPALTLYANIFLDEALDNLPTAGVVVVDLESNSWKGIGRKHVKRCLVDFPKNKA